MSDKLCNEFLDIMAERAINSIDFEMCFSGNAILRINSDGTVELIDMKDIMIELPEQNDD